MTVGCVLLAAGSAQRFGGRKLHACLCGQSLIARALEAVPDGIPAAVVTGDDAIAQQAQARGLQVVINNRPDDGISRSIRLGVQALPVCDALCFLVADQPLLRRESVRLLLDTWRSSPECIVRAYHDGIPGNPCVFPQRLFSALCALRGDRGGGEVIRANLSLVLPVELPHRELLDCDTKQALEMLKAMPDA